MRGLRADPLPVETRAIGDRKMACNEKENEKQKVKDEGKKLKPESTENPCECDDLPAEAGEGKKADDAATEELDEKSGKKNGKRTSNDSGALAGPNTKPTIRPKPPEED
jgi:hypothetical protein